MSKRGIWNAGLLIAAWLMFSGCVVRGHYVYGPYDAYGPYEPPVVYEPMIPAPVVVAPVCAPRWQHRPVYHHGPRIWYHHR